jgi:hypothetical protein
MQTDPEGLKLEYIRKAPPPRLRRARFEDYDGIAALASAERWLIEPVEGWMSYWTQNPLWPRLRRYWPIGWVLEDASGKIVGSFMNIPSLYNFRGVELICANGRSWVVDAAYRGYALQLIDEYFNQQGSDLFINTTVGQLAAPVLERLSNRVPVGDWAVSSCWISNHVSFAKERLRLHSLPFSDWLAYPASAVLELRELFYGRRIPRGSQSLTLECVDNFDAEFDWFWDALIRKNRQKLLADRSTQSLRWHFALPMRTKRLWIFTARRKGVLEAYCTLIRKLHGSQVGIVDYQTLEEDAESLPCLLQAALKRCAEDGIQVLSNAGRGVPKMRLIDHCAPYIIKQDNWCFFFSAADKHLHRELQEPQCWDPSCYDGDASLN